MYKVNRHKYFLILALFCASLFFLPAYPVKAADSHQLSQNESKQVSVSSGEPQDLTTEASANPDDSNMGAEPSDTVDQNTSSASMITDVDNADKNDSDAKPTGGEVGQTNVVPTGTAQAGPDTGEQSSDNANSKVTDQQSTTITQTEQEDINARTTTNTSRVVSKSQQPLKTQVAEKHGYFTIIDPSTPVYKKDLSLGSTEMKLGNATFEVISQLMDTDGQLYYGIKRDASLIGYVPDVAGTFSTGASGAGQTFQKYVQISKRNWKIWKNFEWTASTSTTPVYHQYYLASTVFFHYNGAQYYRLTNNQNQLVGYYNAAGATIIDKPQQTGHMSYRYVTFGKPNWNLYSSFTWSPKSTSTNYLGKSAYAKYYFHHVNGSTYYSIYSLQNQWLGYINASAVKTILKPQGKYQRISQFAKVLKNSTIWQSFGWKVKGNSRKLINQRVVARYGFHHLNGQNYYSLYSVSGSWIGYYLADNAQLLGTTIAFKKVEYGTVARRSWKFWQTLTWRYRESTNRWYGDIVLVKKGYHHANGVDYYSVWVGRHWAGYLNQHGLAMIPKPQGQTIRLGATIKIASASYQVYADFVWTKRGTTTPYYRHNVTARYAFQHVNGMTYFSIYSGSHWIGYVNAKATSLTNILYRVLSVANYNQYRLGIPEGCEGVSLLQALKAKGYAKNYSPRAFLSKIPKASSPYRGFVGSPFVSSGQYTAIFATPLANWGSKFGKVVNLSKQSVSSLYREVLLGNPVVVYVTIHLANPQWANWPFGRVPNNNHAVTLSGVDYKRKRVYLSDPIDGKYWVAMNKFAAIYNTRKMAVAVR